MKCKQVSIVAELLHLSIYLLPMSTLLSVYLFHVLAFQHKLLLVHMISHFSVLSLPFLIFLYLLSFVPFVTFFCVTFKQLYLHFH